MSCGHEECKNFYILNKQIKMYGLPSLSNVLKPTQNTIQIPTAQPSQNGQPKPSQSFTTPTELNGKRPRTALGDISSRDQEESPVHKAVKTESNFPLIITQFIFYQKARKEVKQSHKKAILKPKSLKLKIKT